MARKSSARVDEAPGPAARTTDDPGALLGTWIESQRNLLGVQFDQLMQGQQALLKSWFGMLDLATPWQAQMAGWTRVVDADDKSVERTWRLAPEDVYRDTARLLELWWSPWAPFLTRGAEQLA
jgi:hypothetical protein